MSRAGNNRSVNVTDGDLVRPMLVLSAPIVLSMLLQVGYNLADTFWVGQLGQDPVAALSLAWPLIFLMISVAGGFTVAGTVLVAQHRGAGNDDRVDHVAGQTIAFVTVLAVVLSVVGYLLAPTLVSLIGGDSSQNVTVQAVEYVRIIFLGVVFMFGFFIFQSLLRGWGDTRTPLYLMAFGVALNVLLDPFLVLGFQNNPLFGWLGLDALQTQLYALTGFPGMGVRGAAVATVVSRGIGAVLGMFWLFSGAVGISLSVDDLLLKRETVTRIVRIGAPSSVEQSMMALGITALTALVALSGDNAIAAFGIGNRVSSLVFLPALGLARGTETVVGQNLGARQPERSRRAVFVSVAVIAAAMTVVAVVTYLIAPAIIDVFIQGPNEASVIATGAEFLRILALSFAFLGAYNVVQGGFRGAGSTRLAMLFSILWQWGFRIPIAAGLAIVAGMGATGVWWGIAAGNVLGFVAAALWFLRGSWDDTVIDDDAQPGVGPEGDAAAIND